MNVDMMSNINTVGSLVLGMSITVRKARREDRRRRLDARGGGPAQNSAAVELEREARHGRPAPRVRRGLPASPHASSPGVQQGVEREQARRSSRDTSVDDMRPKFTRPAAASFMR